MLRRVLILGRVAAADMPADHALPQVNPAIARFQAFFAARAARRHFANLIEMRTFWPG